MVSIYLQDGTISLNPTYRGRLLVQIISRRNANAWSTIAITCNTTEIDRSKCFVLHTSLYFLWKTIWTNNLLCNYCPINILEFYCNFSLLPWNKKRSQIKFFKIELALKNINIYWFTLQVQMKVNYLNQYKKINNISMFQNINKCSFFAQLMFPWSIQIKERQNRNASNCDYCLWTINGSQLAKMKKSIPNMSPPWHL